MTFSNHFYAKLQTYGKIDANSNASFPIYYNHYISYILPYYKKDQYNTQPAIHPSLYATYTHISYNIKIYIYAIISLTIIVPVKSFSKMPKIFRQKIFNSQQSILASQIQYSQCFPTPQSPYSNIH